MITPRQLLVRLLRRIDTDYRLTRVLDEKCYTHYAQQWETLYKINSDDSIDLNQHRELVQRLAMFCIVETATYWNWRKKTEG